MDYSTLERMVNDNLARERAKRDRQSHNAVRRYERDILIPQTRNCYHYVNEYGTHLHTHLHPKLLAMCAESMGTGWKLITHRTCRRVKRSQAMYTVKNYQTKKELIADVKAGVAVRVYQHNGDLFSESPPTSGRVYIEGPHFPQPHKWYASAELLDGLVVKVK